MKVDFIIVGQGLAGSLLGMEMIKAGKQVRIIDQMRPDTASKKAGGLYNPITGRKMVKTWKADELFAGIESYYEGLEVLLNCKFLNKKKIYRPFISIEEQNDWMAKSIDPAYKPYIAHIYTRSTGINGLADSHGGIVLTPSGFIEVPTMLAAITDYMTDLGVLQDKVFDYKKMRLSDMSIRYDSLEADRIIFCEGPRAVKNPYWNHLPFRLVKGETVNIEADLPEDMIINRGVFVLPLGGYFKVGSTYDHQQLDYEPTEAGKNEILNRLTKVYRGDFTFQDAAAGVRPATYDRRPFIGIHPEWKQIGIFNGFGTKGVSLIPYFANQFLNYLSGNGELDTEVNVVRNFM